MAFSDSSQYFYFIYKVGFFSVSWTELFVIYMWENESFCVQTFYLETCLSFLVPTALRWGFQGFLYQDHGILGSDSLTQFQFRWCIFWQDDLARTRVLCEFVVSFYHEWVLDCVECVSGHMIMYYFSLSSLCDTLH